MSSLTRLGSTKTLKKAKSFHLAKTVDINTKKFRLPDATWVGEKSKRDGDCKMWIDSLVDSVLLEVAVGVIIAADLVLTILTFTLPEEVAESTLVFAVGGIFLIVLLGDVVLRVAKYRLTFFHRPLNWLEFIVAVAGCVMLVFEGVERAGCGGPCNNNRSAAGGGTSLGRSIRPTIKAWRIVRTMMQLTNSRGGLHKQMHRQTDRFFGRLIRLYLNDFFIIARQNVYMKPSQGMLHVEKAQVRSSVLKGLHLPLTISCGIIDLVHVKVDLSRGASDEGGEDSNHKMLVVIENALIVVGPGHHQEMPAPPWDFDAVLEGKQKLIDLLTRRLEAASKKNVASKGGKKGGVGRALKSRAKAHVEEVLSRGVHISIHNLEIRYEDPQGQLAGRSGASVVGGMRIGFVTVRAAGATDDDELEEQEDFRAKGKWRFDPGGDTTQFWQNENVDCDGVGEVRRASVMSSAVTRKTGNGKTVRRLSQGVRVAMTADRICAFWDLHKLEQADADNHEHSVAARYTDMLVEGSGVDIAAFLEDHANVRRRERCRLGLCKFVEERMAHTVGRCVAREFARRLRDRVAAHKYVVMPFGGSIHAVVRPPASEAVPSRSTVGTKLLPHVDVSMEIEMTGMCPDVRQVASMAWMADYIKRWLQEDRRFQWRPPPTGLGHSRSTLATARWNYALHRILNCVDPSHNWHCLAWIGMQRRIDCRAAYYTSLTGKPPLDQENIALLQVALPLPDALSIRKEAAFNNALTKMRQGTRKGIIGSIKAKLPFGRKKLSGDSLDTRNMDLEMGDAPQGLSNAVSSKPSTSTASTTTEQSKEPGGKKTFRASEMSVQVHVIIGTAKMGVLSPEAYVHAPRRPIMLGQATALEVIAALCSPRRVWIRMAPPEALAEVSEGPHPQGIVFEFSVASVRAVFYGAPSTAWKLRRAFFCGGGSLGPRGGRPEDDTRTFAPGLPYFAGQNAARGSYSRGSRPTSIEKALLEARIRLRVADMGPMEDKGNWHVTRKCNWRFSACIPALEVHILKPLIQALLLTVKPPKTPLLAMAAAEAAAAHQACKEARLQRQSSKNSKHSGHSGLSGQGNYTIGGSSSSSGFHQRAAETGARVMSDFSFSGVLPLEVGLAPDFWAELVELQRMRAARASVDRKHRLNEKLTGAAGFLKGSFIRGSIALLGGLRADVLAPHTGDQWALQAVHIPAGTVDVSRGGIPPGLKAGFKPSTTAPGTPGGLTQASDGWWFETEAEAKSVSERLREERFGRRTSSVFSSDEGGGREGNDTSCVGEDAAEDPPEGAFSGDGVVKAAEISAWQSAMVKALRYKPRESERGLLQTQSPRSPRTPTRKSLVKPSASSPFCCHDLSMAACAKSIPARNRSASGDRTLHPLVLPRPQATPVFAPPPFEKPFEKPLRCGRPPPAPSLGDIDVWLETLLPEDAGLPKPKHAEDLWAAMGCARTVAETAHPMFSRR